MMWKMRARVTIESVLHLRNYIKEVKLACLRPWVQKTIIFSPSVDAGLHSFDVIGDIQFGKCDTVFNFTKLNTSPILVVLQYLTVLTEQIPKKTVNILVRRDQSVTQFGNGIHICFEEFLEVLCSINLDIIQKSLWIRLLGKRLLFWDSEELWISMTVYIALFLYALGYFRMSCIVFVYTRLFQYVLRCFSM